MLSSPLTRFYLLALSLTSMPLGSRAGWEWAIQTVYDSPTCTGAVVQNNYFISYEDCVANSTCGVYSDDGYAGYSAVLGCSKMEDASTAAYTAATLGSNEDHVAWILYYDKACEKMILASDSHMANSLSEARCNPTGDGISKKYTYDSAKTITISQYANENCSGTPTNGGTLYSNQFGTCLPLGDISFKAYVFIDGISYTTPSSASSLNTLGVAALSWMALAWAMM